MKQPPLLEVNDLSLEFRTRSGVVLALENVSFSIAKGEIVGVVGESGSGKSVTAFTVMGILDRAGHVTGGSISLGGFDVLNAREVDMQELRGREVSMIFQSPRSALNPIRQVGKQIEDVLRRHAPAARHQLRQRAIEALTKVRIPDPERRYKAYPFELSGGMCQRIMIATALACSPALLIADEPTTGLDVTTQAAIMDLIKDLSRDNNMATLLITHDLHLAAEVCDRIVVMHAGHVVESAPTEELFRAPKHPYTARLIAATPTGGDNLDEISSIPGNLPDLRASALPPCRFAMRCERRIAQCDLPELELLPVIHEDHLVACRRPL
jgi:peptide/nickel transport system ATP-binding protein